MTFSPQNSLSYFLEENIEFSKNSDDLAWQLEDFVNNNAKAINAREIGIYNTIELIIGQKYFTTDPQKFNDVFRKVFSFDAIATGATLNIAHNIDFINNFTRMYGTVITNVPDDRPIPYIDVVNVANQISLSRNGLNLIIVNGAIAPPITSGIIVVEYIKN